ncbi:hypothetical protein [Robertmurraya siralis]|nr:hypothetical protein [Robertmurraya siralis]
MESKELEQVFLKGAQYSSIGRFSGIIASVLVAALFSVQATILTA